MSLEGKLIGIGLLFVLHFVLGYWLSSTGKPFNVAVLTAHKLASLGALVLILLTVRQVWGSVNVGGLAVVAIAVTVLLFVVTIGTGGWLSAENPDNATVSDIHRFVPYLVVLSTLATGYLLVWNPS